MPGRARTNHGENCHSPRRSGLILGSATLDGNKYKIGTDQRARVAESRPETQVHDRPTPRTPGFCYPTTPTPRCRAVGNTQPQLAGQVNSGREKLITHNFDGGVSAIPAKRFSGRVITRFTEHERSAFRRAFDCIIQTWKLQATWNEGEVKIEFEKISDRYRSIKQSAIGTYRRMRRECFFRPRDRRAPCSSLP